MEGAVDLKAVQRDPLFGIIERQQAIIVRQQTVIERLKKRIAHLEGKAGGNRKPDQLKQPHKRAVSRQQVQCDSTTASNSGSIAVTGNRQGCPVRKPLTRIAVIAAPPTGSTLLNEL